MDTPKAIAKIYEDNVKLSEGLLDWRRKWFESQERIEELEKALQMAIDAHGTGKAPGAVGAGSWFDHARQVLEGK